MGNKFLIVSMLILFCLSTKAKSEEYTWYDGKNYHKIYLVNNKLAHFSKRSQQAVRIVNPKDVSVRSLKDTSPVFSKKSGGPVSLALAGGMIVYFDFNANEEEIKRILSKYNLILGEKLPFVNKNAWSVKLGPGMQNLIIANKLNNEKHVKVAMPNWWFPKFVK